jgi:hypothetical protein
MANRKSIIAISLLVFILGLSAAPAQTGLQSINPPQGGKIVYGTVDHATTEAEAMGNILRSLHQSIGAKPEVGKLFDVKGTDSVATFFSITRRDQGPGKAPLKVAGLLIATKVSTDHVEAALVSDDAARFPKTLQPMMKQLMAVWHPMQAASSASTGDASSEAAAPLQLAVTQDRSASIGLPSNWHLVPNMSMMGTLVAVGPNKETAEMGTTFLTGDTNNPRVRQLLRTLQNGGLRNTAYANANYYPYGADPARAFVYLMGRLRQKARLPQASYNFSSETALPTSSQTRCARLAGTADMNDGTGGREIVAVFCALPPGPGGNWMSMAYTTMAPMQIAGRDRATLAAIMQSFKVNEAVIDGQTRQIAGPAVHAIQAYGNMVGNRIAATHQAEAIHNSSVYQHWDSIDRRSQEFGNYQLGYAVVSDTGNNAHGTLWADDAAALVQANPDRFEYVSAPNYWKGIDY